MVNFIDRNRESPRLAALLDSACHLDALPVLVSAAHAPEWPVVFVNQAFTDATGLTLHDLVDLEVLTTVGGAADQVRAALAQVRVALAEERPSSVLLWLPRLDGVQPWVRGVITPVPDDNGRPTHWALMLVDATAEVEREAMLIAEVEGTRRENAALGLVARVSDLAMDLDDPDGLQDIAGLLARSVVRWATFYLDDDGLHQSHGLISPLPGHQCGSPGPTAGNPRRFRGADSDPVQRLLDGTMQSPHTIDLTVVAPGTATAWLAADLTQWMADTVAEGAERVLVLPVPGRHRVLGLMVVVTRLGDENQNREIHTVLNLTAHRVGLATENVRLYAREHKVAETLQRALLPEQADVDGLDVWSYYAPNVVDVQVGGDWYDVAQLGPDLVGVVVGDVVGHDVAAAAAMGQLRSIVRACAFEVTDPASVLERVDTLVAGMRIPRAAGLVLSTLTRIRREDGPPVWRFAYSRAGHLPVLLRRKGRVTALDEVGGALIGFGQGPRETAEVTVEPEDVLVFYTDGLIERRSRPLPEGLDALCRAVAGATSTDAAGIGEELLAQLAGNPEDDVAVVVVRVPGLLTSVGSVQATTATRSRRWRFPSEQTSVARARHAVANAVRSWDFGDSSNAELVVSELVTNAVMHGWGQVTLLLRHTEDGLRIEVADSNPLPPVMSETCSGQIGGFGMRIVERLAEWGWRPSGAGKTVWAQVRPGPAARPDGGVGGESRQFEADGFVRF